MTIDKAELHYLGFGDVESYGLSWRTEGSGGHITNSQISHLYFGLYSFDVGGLTISDNEVRDNVLYGIDPHTGSHNLTIERNVVHDNGKHGIILAEDCVDSVIRDNVVYRNQHHGIVLYLHSDRNLIEGNETFNNASQGININESSNNTIKANRVYDNIESGIGIGQTAKDNARRGQRRPRQQAGRAAPGQRGQPDRVRDNVIGENERYGIYVDSDGPFTMAGNTIWANRTGVMLKGPSTPSRAATASSATTNGTSRTAEPRADRRARCTAGARSEHRQVGRQLVRRDVAAVGVPLRALVAQEEVEDVLAEDLRDQLGVLHRRQRLVRGSAAATRSPSPGARSRSSDQTSSSAGGRQLVALLRCPAGRRRGSPRRPGTGCRPCPSVRISTRRDDALPGEYIGTRTSAERFACPQQTRRRGLAADDQPLVGVHPLVGDRGDLAGVLAACPR